MRERDVGEGLKRYGKVVIWGLRRSVDSFRYIHQHFFQTLRKLEANVVWCDDTAANREIVASGDLVFAVNVACAHLPVVDGAFYVLHNTDDALNAKIPADHRIRLQVYTTATKRDLRAQKWMSATYFIPEVRMLVQPWGTNLMPSEFYRPLPGRVRKHTLSFWVGAVWQNALGQGNIEQIAQFKRALRRHHRRFAHLRFVPNWLNAEAIRWSCLAPAIAGSWQAENHYLPCRMFKNISYGHLGLSNVMGFDDVLGDSACLGGDFDALIDFGMSLGDAEFSERIAAQQEWVREHTYVNKLANILRAMETV